MAQPLVTIVITTYKSRPDHLGAAIASALEQTWPAIEILVSDDSPDAQLQSLVEQFQDDRLHYRRNVPALGVARNHWVCFQAAQGEFIAVLNHDDLFAPTFLAQLVPPLIANPDLALAFCDHWVIDSEGDRLLAETEQSTTRWGRATLTAGEIRPFFHLLAAQTIPMVMGAVFRRDQLPDHLPEQAGPAYDLWLTYLLCRRGQGAYFVPDRLSSWRAHAANLTSQQGVDWFLGAATCWQEIAADPRLTPIHALARRKAAVQYYFCALGALQARQPAQGLAYGWRSLRMRPTWQGLAVCMLSLLPTPLAQWLRHR